MTNNMSYQQWGIHQCTAEWMDARMDKWTVVDSGVNHCTTNTFFFLTFLLSCLATLLLMDNR